MRARIAVIVITGAVVLLGGYAFWILSQPPVSSGTAPAATAPLPSPAAVPSASSAPAPVRSTPRRATPAAPKPAAPAAPPAETAPATGTLHIVADVAEASVFIDRKFIGTAPVTASDLAPGPHHLNVSAAGYDAVSEDLDVTPGAREIAIAFKEIRLAASIQVSHKHAMGSCVGTLRASPRGVTYETANRSDAFTVALTGIEIFEVDYLNKNLKLKVKKGKTYNFADPDGNADRLFVFHRDVQKVRQRLVAGGVH